MDVKITAQGVGMTEALLTAWLKQPGDVVSEGDAIAEIETDKSNIELTAPIAGRLGPHLAASGQVVEVGTTIVTIDESAA